MEAKKYRVIGLMSGSSLDGLDIAFCEFTVDTANISDWKIIHAETVPLSEMWQSRLAYLPQQSAKTYAQTHVYFGHYLADLVNDFLEKMPSSISDKNRTPDFIASHGHTIFHFPDKRFTAQIGDGAAIAVKTGYPVISDFRTQDIAINGEGTPLAPLADKHLFAGYDFYLNVGGIANVSCNVNGKMIAFDIGGANQVLNGLAQLANVEYDDGGKLSASGNIVNELLQTINSIPYFAAPYPKSLGNQWVRNNLVKTYLEYPASVEDRLRTAVEQLAEQTVSSLLQIIDTEKLEPKKFRMLATGGGVFNSFLMERIEVLFAENESAKLRGMELEIIIPEPSIIDFKEAILIALLGVLRVENIPNCLASVTGASRDTIGGSIHQGSQKFI